MVLLDTGYVNGQSHKIFCQSSILADFFLATFDLSEHSVHIERHEMQCPVGRGLGGRVGAVALPILIQRLCCHGYLAEDPLTACIYVGLRPGPVLDLSIVGGPLFDVVIHCYHVHGLLPVRVSYD